MHFDMNHSTPNHLKNPLVSISSSSSSSNQSGVSIRRRRNTMHPNKQVLLKNYVSGYLKESDFELKTSTITFRIPRGSKALIVKNLFLACDPYMRHLMFPPDNEFASVLAPFSPGSVVIGYGVAKVIKSGDAAFEEGDFVWGKVGWEEYSILHNTWELFKIKQQHSTNVPLSYYAGILGMPGVAAYVGFYNICNPKKGEVVYVSSAAGGVGQLVGQFAKMMGCYVVGSTSTNQKVHMLKSKLGFDDAFNYSDGPDLATNLKRHFPKGIDIYFDNVGGKMLDEVLVHMNVRGRIAVSGMISQYNLSKPDGIHNLFCLITKRIRVEGFVELDFKHQIYPQYLDWALENLSEKKLVFAEDIAEGLENAASALVGIYHGRNVGKQLVRVSME